jgi:alkylation response protein AidB-like acyl-CoA dehydrogenase
VLQCGIQVSGFAIQHAEGVEDIGLLDPEIVGHRGAGGFGIFRKGPFEQLFRDARLGRIHPANSMLTHELCAKLTLGIDPDEQPRWG